MTLLQEFRSRLLDLSKRFPRVARGGLGQRELVDLAKRVARHAGYSVDVAFRPWPWPAAVTRIGRTLLITVDDRRHPADQVMALAHEVGHIVLGHYHAEPFWTEVDGPYQRDEDRQADLFASIILDKRTSPLEYLRREQLELL